MRSRLQWSGQSQSFQYRVIMAQCERDYFLYVSHNLGLTQGKYYTRPAADSHIVSVSRKSLPEKHGRLANFLTDFIETFEIFKMKEVPIEG